MASDIKLTNPNVNGGSPVYLRGATLTYSFKPLTNTRPASNSFALSETQIAGFENPKIVITGYIDTDNLASSVIQHSSLLAFAKNEYLGTDATATSLTVITGENDSPLYAVDGSTSVIKVVVESFSCRLSTADSRLAAVWAYSLNLVETK